MRECFYGFVLGAAFYWGIIYFDAEGTLAYLNTATESAVKSTHGYSR